MTACLGVNRWSDDCVYLGANSMRDWATLSTQQTGSTRSTQADLCYSTTAPVMPSGQK